MRVVSVLFLMITDISRFEASLSCSLLIPKYAVTAQTDDNVRIIEMNTIRKRQFPFRYQCPGSMEIIFSAHWITLIMY